MSKGDARHERDHTRVRLPASRLATIWGVALAIACTFLLVRSADQDARQDAALEHARAMAETTAGLVALEIGESFDRLEAGAEALLTGEIDRAALDAALPITGLPFAAVLQADSLEVLAINIDVDVTGPQMVEFMPSIARAVGGQRSVGQLSDVVDTPIVAFAVSFAAQDGSERIFAVGTLLDQSRFVDVIEVTDGAVGVSLQTLGGQELLRRGPQAGPDVRQVGSTVANAPWKVVISGDLTDFDPDLASIWFNPWVLVAMTLLVAGLLATWITRALSDAATIEAAYGRMAWAARQQQEFSALVSHELRTPATSASGLASFLASQWDRLDPDRRLDLAERVARSTAALAELVDDLELSSRVSTAVLPLSPRPQQVIALLDVALGHAGVPRAELTIRGDLDAIVEVDTRYASRAIAGVLHNARVHGGAPIEITVAATAADVAIVVRDHGPGIAADFRDVMFEPFTQQQSHLRRSHGGTGLGLHLVAAIIEQLGGRISHHDAHPGAAFAIHLPSTQRRSTKTEPASAIRAAT